MTSGASSAKPVLFTDTGIDVAQLPAEWSNYTIRAIIPKNQDTGENWTGDARGDLGSGGEEDIDLPEEPVTGALGKILQTDPKRPYWLVRNAVIEEEDTSPVTIFVNGPPGVSNAPVINTVYWIESEAFFVLSVTDVSISTGLPMSWRLVANRAQCGSFAERHEIDPASYGEGSSGADKRMYFESKPNFEAHRFKGSFISWKLPVNRSKVATQIERRNFFLKSIPELIEKDGKFFYRIKPTAIAEVIRDHKFSATPKEVSNETRIQVVQLEEESSAAGYFSRPKKARVAMTRLKTELLFRHALHLPPSAELNTPLLGDLWTRIQRCELFVKHRIVIRSMGTWVFQISNIFFETFFGIKKATLDLDLISYEPGSTLSTAHPTGGPTSGFGGLGIGFLEPPPPFEKGWSWNLGTTVAAGEDAPTLELRWAFQCQPVQALMILLLSRGGGTTVFYDRMVGRPLAFPVDWLNTESENIDPQLIDPRTKKLLELNQLLNETIVPQFSASDTVGAFIRNINLFYLLLFTALANGRVTWRRWATSLPEGLQALIPLKSSLDIGTLLEPLRAIRLLSGINDWDLSPQFGRTATLGGIQTTEAIDTAVPLQIYQPGNVISDDALKSEAFSVFFKALFSVLGGQPRLHAVETDLDVQTFDPGDVSQWTDKRLPTCDGIGFANVRFFVVGKQVKFLQNTAVYRVLRDYYNETSTTEGRGAPALMIESVTNHVGDSYTLNLTSIGDPSYEIDSSYDEIYNEFAGINARLRIWYPYQQNPAPTAEEERTGFSEVYVVVQSLFINPRGHINRMVVTCDSSFDRGGLTRYDVIRRGAFVVFSDRREDEQNPEGVLIEPTYFQLYADGAGFDYAKWGDNATFDRNYTLITSVP